LRVLSEYGWKGRRLHRVAVIKLIRDQRLRACCSPAKGKETLRSTAGSGASLRSAAHQVARRSKTFCCGEASTTCQGPVVTGHFHYQIKMLERRPILAFEDVLRHDIDADIVFVRHKEEKTRRRDLEVDDDCVGVCRRRLLHCLLHIDTPAHFGAQIAQGVEGK